VLQTRTCCSVSTHDQREGRSSRHCQRFTLFPSSGISLVKSIPNVAATDPHPASNLEPAVWEACDSELSKA
jgi:hypothetical protein